MYDLETKNITIELSQHEAIVGMKRGSDTIRDVIDRLLERDIDGRLCSLEAASNKLVFEIRYMESAVKELKKVLHDRL